MGKKEFLEKWRDGCTDAELLEGLKKGYVNLIRENP
jgi:hypothetical protein